MKRESIALVPPGKSSIAARRGKKGPGSLNLPAATHSTALEDAAAQTTSLFSRTAKELPFTWSLIDSLLNSSCYPLVDDSKTSHQSSISFAGRKIEFKKIRKLGEGGFGTVFLYEISEARNASAKPIIAAMKECTHDTHEKKLHEIAKHERYCTDGYPHIMQYRAADPIQCIFFCDYYPDSLDNYLRKIILPKTRCEQQQYYRRAMTAILNPIALALDHLHNPPHAPEPAYHLDIKPANVLLDKNGHAVLADFGCARAHSKIQSFGLLEVGTYELYAPERFLLNTRSLDHDTCSKITDAWQLGLLIKDLLHLAKPTPESASEDDAVFIRHERFCSWAKNYTVNYLNYLAAEKKQLAVGRPCKEFLRLNNLANNLLAPLDYRPCIKDIIDYKAGNLDTRTDWGAELARIKNSLSGEPSPKTDLFSQVQKLGGCFTARWRNPSATR